MKTFEMAATKTTDILITIKAKSKKEAERLIIKQEGTTWEEEDENTTMHLETLHQR